MRGSPFHSHKGDITTKGTGASKYCQVTIYVCGLVYMYTTFKLFYILLSAL